MNGMTDLRVVKTKRAITAAFIALLDEKEFESITVQDVLKRALINRSTFYRYYASKYDLAEALQDEQLEQFRKMCGTGAEIQTMFSYTYEHRNLLRALCRIHTDTFDFLAGWRSALEDGYRTGQQPCWEEAAQLQTQLFLHSAMGSLLYILEQNRPIDAAMGRSAFYGYCAEQLGVSQSALEQFARSQQNQRRWTPAVR